MSPTSPAESNSKAPSEACGAIAMPVQSSHAVLVLGVERELADGSFHTAKMRLVDLAPSDGIEKDSGLVALGAVLAAMADGKAHLPCRARPCMAQYPHISSSAPLLTEEAPA